MTLRIERRPLAGQIRDAILGLIYNEGLQAGDRLPSEQSLVDRFGVSRTALREALRLLEDERIITCHHGIGRFVAPKNISDLTEDISRLTSMTELTRALNVSLQRFVLGVEEQDAGEEIGGYLQLSSGAKVVVLARAWLDDGKAIIVSVDHFSRTFYPGPLATGYFETSLVALLEQNGMPRIEYAKSTIRAKTLPAQYALPLGVKRTEPWVLLDQVNFSAGDIPLLYSQDYYCSERIIFRVLRRRR